MTLNELAQHFSRLYGLRNAILSSGRMERIHVLLERVAELKRAVRKEGPQSPIVHALLASVVGRLFAVVDSFREFPFIDAMIYKFPSYGCSYCGEKPCRCVEKRPDPQSQRSIDNTQRIWTLKDWARHLNEVYGQHRNRAFGFDYLVSRLNDEILEMSLPERKIHAITGGLDVIEFAFAKEAADTLSWIIAVSNFLEVDLEAVVMQRYGSGCPRCMHIPCDCPHVVSDPFTPISWDKLIAPPRNKAN